LDISPSASISLLETVRHPGRQGMKEEAFKRICRYWLNPTIFF
jgi:hypothetical protein